MAYDVLSAWNHRATNDSVAMTIFNRWRDRMTRGTSTAQARAAALNQALDELAERFGKWQRSEEHTSEPSHSQISYAVFCLKKKEHTSELQSQSNLVCRLLLEKKRAHV